MKRYIPLIILVPVILLSSCATPVPLIKLQPVQEEAAKWYFGKAYVSSEKDSVILSIAFEEASLREIIMDVEISNLSSQTVLVSPERFGYAVSQDSTFQEIIRWGKAKDPETQLLQLDMERSRQEADYKNQRFFITGLAVAATAVTIAKVSRDAKQRKNLRAEEQWNSRIQSEADLKTWASGMQALGFLAQRERLNFAWDQADLQVLKQNWAQHSLRKTHLYPGEVIQGKVIYFPHQQNAYLNFTFPIGGRNLEAAFKLRKINVY